MVLGVPVATVIVWLIVGLLAGSAATSLLYRSRRGLGVMLNTGLGMLGAVIGGFLFSLFGVNIATLQAIQIDMQQLFSAFLGAVLILVILRGLRR